jgi:hypothetical protein
MVPSECTSRSKLFRTGGPDRAGVIHDVLVTYRLAATKSNRTAEATMASKMRSKRPSRRSRTGRRPRPSWGQWTGVPLNDATQHAPPRDLRETMGIVPSGIAEWPLMQRQGASRGLTKRIHHPATQTPLSAALRARRGMARGRPRNLQHSVSRRLLV